MSTVVNNLTTVYFKQLILRRFSKFEKKITNTSILYSIPLLFHRTPKYGIAEIYIFTKDPAEYATYLVGYKN